MYSDNMMCHTGSCAETGCWCLSLHTAPPTDLWIWVNFSFFFNQTLGCMSWEEVRQSSIFLCVLVSCCYYLREDYSQPPLLVCPFFCWGISCAGVRRSPRPPAHPPAWIQEAGERRHINSYKETLICIICM